MHPIFERKTWFAGYLTAWALIAGLVAGLLRLPGTLGWRDALIVSGPLCLFYAFVCLTPWYMSRHRPLRSSNAWRMTANHLIAAVLASAIWVQAARWIAESAGFMLKFRAEIAELVVTGLSLYLLS